MKSTFILSILSLGSLLSTPKFVETYDQNYTQAPMQQTPHSKKYIDISISGNGAISVISERSPVKSLPLLPSLGIRYRKYPKPQHNLGFDLDVTGACFISEKPFPIIEVKGGPVYFLSPEENISNYIGYGIGASLPRIVPVYLSFGREYNLHNTNGSKVELELSTSAFPHPAAIFLGANAKVSYGFGF